MSQRLWSRVIGVIGAALVASPCVPECVRLADVPSQKLARVEVNRCESSASYADRVLADVPLRWVIGWYESTVSGNSGVVLSGRAVEWIGVDQLSEHEFRLGESSHESFDGEWFYPANEDLCSEWLNRTAVILISDTCCDVYPPYDFPCFFGVGQSWPVPAALETVLRLEDDA